MIHNQMMFIVAEICEGIMWDKEFVRRIRIDTSKNGSTVQFTRIFPFSSYRIYNGVNSSEYFIVRCKVGARRLHEAILSRSQYFKNYYVPGVEFVFDAMSRNCLRAVCRFLNTGHVELEIETEDEFLHYCNILMIDGLCMNDSESSDSESSDSDSSSESDDDGKDSDSSISSSSSLSDVECITLGETRDGDESSSDIDGGEIVVAGEILLAKGKSSENELVAAAPLNVGKYEEHLVKPLMNSTPKTSAERESVSSPSIVDISPPPSPMKVVEKKKATTKRRASSDEVNGDLEKKSARRHCRAIPVTLMNELKRSNLPLDKIRERCYDYTVTHCVEVLGVPKANLESGELLPKELEEVFGVVTSPAGIMRVSFLTFVKPRQRVLSSDGAPEWTEETVFWCRACTFKFKHMADSLRHEAKHGVTACEMTKHNNYRPEMFADHIGKAVFVVPGKSGPSMGDSVYKEGDSIDHDGSGSDESVDNTPRFDNTKRLSNKRLLVVIVIALRLCILYCIWCSVATAYNRRQNVLSARNGGQSHNGSGSSGMQGNLKKR